MPGTSLEVNLLLQDGAVEQRCQMTKTPFTIGRLPDRDVILTHPYVSREHAQLLRDRLLHQFQFVVLELDYLAAAFADEMVVMMLAGDFVARLALVEMALGEQVAFLQ